MNELTERFIAAPIVPLIQSEDPALACKVATALAAGGLSVVEVVMRTEQAMQCLAAIANDVPEVIAGAGTILNEAQCRQAVTAGAKFIVSPGIDDGVIGAATDHQLPVFPGTGTATEVQRAWNLGLRAVKFFPASLLGGVPMLKALSAVYRDMKFMPTGGISTQNLAAYLGLPSVAACGGSWLTPQAVVAAEDFDAITELATQAVEIAASVRSLYS